MARHEVETEVAGNVWKVEVSVGDRVEAGDAIVILESMKMEIPVESPAAGRVAELLVEPKQAVEEYQVIAVVEG